FPAARGRRRGAGGEHGWRLRAANGDGRRTRCPAGAPLRAGTATGGGQALLATWSRRLAMALLRFAAWFLWMTPLLAALSSWRAAARCSSVACATFPASAASRNLRTAVFRDDRTARFRIRAFSFCRMRFFCCLMLAMRKRAPVTFDQ